MKNLFACLLLLVGSTVANADEIAKENLIQRLESYSTLKATFTQTTYTDGEQSQDSSKGRLSIAKPLRFLWLVDYPFAEQVISDGETLWIFDPDLEQATYKPVGADIQQTPAMILAQPREALTVGYSVTEAGNESLVSFRLFPSDDDSLFTAISMIFIEDLIAEIRFEDSFGQETIFQLADVQLNAEVNEDLFNFVPPPGTDGFEQM